MTDQTFPSYDEMLKMGEEDFQEVLLLRTETPYREKLLEEMLEHEKKNGSFAKTATGEISDTQKLILGVFDEDKSVESISLLHRASEQANKHGGDEIDLVNDAIFAKATSDLVNA